MLNSLDPDQAQQNTGPDLGLNCLQRLSADDTSMQRVRAGFLIISLKICIETAIPEYILAS